MAENKVTIKRSKGRVVITLPEPGVDIDLDDKFRVLGILAGLQLRFPDLCARYPAGRPRKEPATKA
jgi:hypothetical protein